MEPVIEIKNIGKKYNITHQRGGYVALRDILTNALKKPFSFLKNKAKQITGSGMKEDFWALRDVSFNVMSGEIIGIIGANGAGKSTLLKILTGITPPTKGEIITRGRVSSLLEVGTGFHPELTGRENIFLNGAILGMKKVEIAKRFDEIVAFADIEKFLDTPVKYYSSGMYVRLAFSVAAHMEPDILLVDEVLAVGDAEFQKKCLDKMDDVAKTSGRTILFVSHNMNAVQKLCTRCVLLEKGQVKMVGKTNEVINNYLGAVSENMGLPLRDRKDRTGLGNIQFQEINNANIYSMGDDIYVSLKIKNSYPKEVAVNLILNILTPTNQALISCDSLLKEKKCILKASGVTEVSCKIQSPPLNAGNYNLNIGIINNHEIEDRIPSAAEFSIQGGKFEDLKRTNEFFPILGKFEWNFE